MMMGSLVLAVVACVAPLERGCSLVPGWTGPALVVPTDGLGRIVSLDAGTISAESLALALRGSQAGTVTLPGFGPVAFTVSASGTCSVAGPPPVAPATIVGRMLGETADEGFSVQGCGTFTYAGPGGGFALGVDPSALPCGVSAFSHTGRHLGSAKVTALSDFVQLLEERTILGVQIEAETRTRVVASEQGPLRAGDLIVSIDGVAVHDLASLRAAFRERTLPPGTPVAVGIERDGAVLTVQAPTRLDLQIPSGMRLLY
jgi:hypothetical protein